MALAPPLPTCGVHKMTLLNYSTTQNLITDRIPVTSQVAPSRNLALWVPLGILVLISFVFGFMTNPELGLLLTGLALIPLVALVAISLYFTPRSEVSLSLRLMAVTWGGAGATSLTLLIVGAVENLFGKPDMNTTVVVQAAVVEEICKGLFVIGMFFFCKSLIRTPLGGAIIGLLVGAGFAFVENIIYFNNAYVQTGWTGLWTTVLLRAGLSFFLHAMATMFTGMFIGYVVSHQNELKFWQKYSFISMGLFASMTIHGLWNGMSSMTTDTLRWAVLYGCFWVPLVVIMSFTLFTLRKAYRAKKGSLLIESAKKGYIRMIQAEKMNSHETRKALYKKDSDRLIQWEASLLRIDYWNKALSATQKDKRIDRLNNAKSKDMLKLAKVITLV